MRVTETLGVAVLVFGIVKTAFVLVQWVVEKEGDQILRRNLDAVYDRLEALTLREIAARVLVRTLAATAQWLPQSGKPKAGLMWWLLAINVLAYLAAQGLYCSLKSECGRMLGHDVIIARFGVAKLIMWFALTFVSSILLQLICLTVVRRLMSHLAIVFSPVRAAAMLIMSLGMLGAVFLGQYGVQQLSTHAAFGLGPFWGNLIPSIQRHSPYMLATAILSIAAGLPVVVFLLVLCLSAALRSLPGAARATLLWVVFRVTTDSTPVLERLGYVAGGVASFSSAVAGFLKA